MIDNFGFSSMISKKKGLGSSLMATTTFLEYWRIFMAFSTLDYSWGIYSIFFLFLKY